MRLEENETEKKIYEKMKKMGFPLDSNGTACFLDVVEELMNGNMDREIPMETWKKALNRVAEKRGLRCESVLRRMIWTIDRTMMTGNLDYIEKIVGKNPEESCGFGRRRTKHFAFSVMMAVRNG